MSPDADTLFTDVENLSVPAREFVAYCKAELERRRNSGEAFDEELFLEALELTLRKFRALENEVPE